MLSFIFIFIPFLAFAEGSDNTPPVIHLDTASLSSKIGRPGDTITFSVKVTDDNSGVFDNGMVIIRNPKGGHSQKKIRFIPGSDTMIMNYDVTDVSETGIYIVEFLEYIQDKEGNSLSQTDLKPLNLSFEVFNPNIDINPPSIDLRSATLDVRENHSEIWFYLSLKVTDDRSGISPYNGSFTLLGPNGNQIPSWDYNAKYDREKDIITVPNRFNKFTTPAGIYKIVSLENIQDEAGNEIPKLDLSHLNLSYEIKDTKLDTAPPFVDENSIKLSSRKINPKEKLFITVDMTDNLSGFFLHESYFIILKPNGEQITATFSSGAGDGPSPNISEINPAKFSAIYNINNGNLKDIGHYRVIKLEGVQDNALNTTPSLELTHLGLSFEVVDSNSELSNQISTNIDSLTSLTPEEKQTLTKNIETMNNLITKKVEKVKSEQDAITLPKNLALQYCIQDLENFLEQHQSELSRYISQLQKQGSTGEIDVTQNLHQQLIDLQTIKYVLLMISEAWETYDNDGHPNEIGKHETELSRVIASKYDDYIGRKDSQCFKLPEFLDQYEKLVIEQLLKTKSYREKLEKNSDMTSASHPEVIEDLRDVLVPLQSSSTTFWHGTTNDRQSEKSKIAN